MKKLSILSLIVLLFFVQNTSVFGKEKDDETEHLVKDAKSAILIEQDTGDILIEKNVNEKLPPASMTKIMTMLLVMQELERGQLDLKEKIQVSEKASSMGGSQVFLETGEEITVQNLLKSIAVASANDASVALAERIAGSEEAFVKLMNKQSEKLGLKNTNFQNASGLPAKNHYSTAKDMAIISKELLKYEDITDYTSIYEDYLRKGEENEFWLVNTNRLVKFHKNVDGLKTGFTNEAKYCLTATAKKGDMRVISVVMGVETSAKRNKVVTNMIDHTFNHYKAVKLHDKGDKITELELLKSDQSTVDVVTSQSVSYLLKKEETNKDIKTTYHIEQDLMLPLNKGTEVGTLTVKDTNSTLTKVPLIVQENVKEASLYKLFKRSMKKIANSI